MFAVAALILGTGLVTILSCDEMQEEKEAMLSEMLNLEKEI